METDVTNDRQWLVPITKSHAALKLGFAVGACAEIGKIIPILKLLDEVYGDLCHWEQLIQDVDPDLASLGRGDPQPLCLATLETSAPAQLEIVGAHAVIHRLRFYLQQRPESRDEKLLESLSGTIAQLRAWNVPETQIDAALQQYILAPLRRVTACRELTLLDEEGAFEQLV